MEKKIRKVVKYENLTPELLKEISKKYPNGFNDHLIKVNGPSNTFFYAFMLEMPDASYLIKVNVKIDSGFDDDEDEEEDDNSGIGREDDNFAASEEDDDEKVKPSKPIDDDDDDDDEDDDDEDDDKIQMMTRMTKMKMKMMKNLLKEKQNQKQKM